MAKNRKSGMDAAAAAARGEGTRRPERARVIHKI